MSTNGSEAQNQSVTKINISIKTIVEMMNAIHQNPVLFVSDMKLKFEQMYEVLDDHEPVALFFLERISFMIISP